MYYRLKKENIKLALSLTVESSCQTNSSCYANIWLIMVKREWGRGFKNREWNRWNPNFDYFKPVKAPFAGPSLTWWKTKVPTWYISNKAGWQLSKKKKERERESWLNIISIQKNHAPCFQTQPDLKWQPYITFVIQQTTMSSSHTSIGLPYSILRLILHLYDSMICREMRDNFGSRFISDVSSKWNECDGFEGRLRL